MADEIIITGREAASIVVDTSGIPAIVADFPVEQNLVVETVYVQGIPGNGGGGGATVDSVAGRTGDVVLSSADLTGLQYSSLGVYGPLPKRILFGCHQIAIGPTGKLALTPDDFVAGFNPALLPA